MNLSELYDLLMAREGRWIYKPLEKWETLPRPIYSFRRTEIYLRCFGRKVAPDLVDWCLENDFLPPPRLRRAKVEALIRSEAARRAGEKRWTVTHQEVPQTILLSVTGPEEPIGSRIFERYGPERAKATL